MAKILGVRQFLTSKKKSMDFEGPWYDLLGRPALSGSWIIWGASGSGKTSFACRLAKYLCNFGRVAYLSWEEGDSLSLQRSFEDVNMMEVNGRLVLVCDMEIQEIIDRLEQPKSWDIIIVDSLQYSKIGYDLYMDLRKKFPRKLFVFISHAEGKKPKGSIADNIRYDSNCKIYIEAFKADAKSRFLDKGQKQKPFIIWEEKAALFWGEQLYNQHMEE